MHTTPMTIAAGNLFRYARLVRGCLTAAPPCPASSHSDKIEGRGKGGGGILREAAVYATRYEGMYIVFPWKLSF